MISRRILFGEKRKARGSSRHSLRADSGLGADFSNGNSLISPTQSWLASENVARRHFTRPIQDMSVGKPIRSGMAEKRPRKFGRVQGRTGGPTATDGPFGYLITSSITAFAAFLSSRSGLILSDRPRWIWPSKASYPTAPRSDWPSGPMSRGRRSSSFMHQLTRRLTCLMTVERH